MRKPKADPKPKKVPLLDWADPVATKAYYRAYDEKNRDKLNMMSRARAKKNNEPRLLAQKKYRDNNKDKIDAIAHARRCKVNIGNFTADDWYDLKKKFRNVCVCCLRGEPDVRLTIDHVIPIRLGGEHATDNIQPLCKSCNSRKGAKAIDYRRLFFMATVHGIQIKEV